MSEIEGKTNEEKPKNAVEEAKELLAKINQAKSENEAILARQEALRAETLLSGQSMGGSVPVQKTKEEEIRARVNAMLAGTGRQI
jgi:hypothetical protein